MRFSTLSLIAAAAVGLAACATSTPYAPAGQDGQYGFAEQKIEEDRYRILFKGNSLTSRETVENYLLYRAAELTVANGFDYFTVVSDGTERETRYTETGYRGPFFYGRGRAFPYYGYGYRWDPFYRDDIEIRQRNRYTAMAVILMGKGDKPADSPTSYTARSVVENLGPLVLRPEAQ